MKTIRDITISGKRVLVRVDFNVPLDDALQITDDTRIKAALPTIELAVEKGAKVVVCSHLGRPKGEPVAKFSLAPVARRLAELLGKAVTMAPDCIGEPVFRVVEKMKEGDVMLLENLRFHPEEEKNDPEFAKGLAALADVYVNDAFAVSHRKNASVEAVTRLVPIAVAGLLLEKELVYFQKAMARPERPLAAIVGGAKVSSKLAALTNMLAHVDMIFIGGAMANTFLKSTGCDMGASLVEEDLLESAASLMKTAREKGIQFFLPVDVVTAVAMDPKAETTICTVDEVPAGQMALDIGPASCARYRQALAKAGTIVWNGPMGVFEMAPFSSGTRAMVEAVGSASAVSIVGGGDTDAAVHQFGDPERFTYISTGGGAFLALLEGKSLPAVSALESVS